MSNDSQRPEAPATDDELASGEAPRPVEWMLLTGSRWGITAGLMVAFFVVLVGLLQADLIAVTNDDTLTRSLAALIGGNLTLITVVISINQLILSREFSSPAELHDRIQKMIAYRQEVAGLISSEVSPPTPDAFFDFLVTMLREETIPLRDEVESLSDEALRTDLDKFTAVLLDESATISETLEGTKNPFETLVVVLDAGFTVTLYDARRIQSLHGDSLPPHANERLEEIVDLLEHIGVARQYLKSLYLQRALAATSRRILYLGVPALGLLLVTTWVYGGDPAPTVQGVELELLVAATGTVAFAPLALFVGYVLRIATITRRTASLMPFTIQEQTRL